ncbi:MAG: sporulation/spore germination protein [Cyanobacteria bacterium P01_D01_bin.156]
MVRFPKILLGLFVAIGLTVAGCNGSAPTEVTEQPAQESAELPATDDAPAEPEEKAAVDVPTAQPNATPESSEKTPKTVPVSIYVMDDSCSKFESESVEVPADTAMTEAIGKVLERHKFASFTLSGYRVNVENNKATVDLRLSEESERQFLSLSSCEQQGLFGGLEETLIQHPDWQVDQVEFTNRGKEIVL